MCVRARRLSRAPARRALRPASGSVLSLSLCGQWVESAECRASRYRLRRERIESAVRLTFFVVYNR